MSDKDLETPKEEVKTEASPETKSQAPSPEQEKLAKLKDEVADLYVRKILNKKKGGLVSLWASLGFNLNPMKKRAKDYILQEDLPEVEESEDLDITQKLSQNIDANIKQAKVNFQNSILQKMPEDNAFSYKQEDLDAMRELLQNPTTEKKLTDLKKAIQKGKDPTKENVQPNTPSVPTNVLVGTGVVATGALGAEIYDKSKYKEPIENKDAKITSLFGKRKDPVTGKEDQQHNGVDIAAPEKTPIHSIVAGKVLKNEKDKNGWGNYITIQGDDGKTYSYLHLNSPSDLEVGKMVKAGDVIWAVGSTGKSTGPHLHLAVKENDKPVDPMKTLPDILDVYKHAA